MGNSAFINSTYFSKYNKRNRILVYNTMQQNKENLIQQANDITQVLSFVEQISKIFFFYISRPLQTFSFDKTIFFFFILRTHFCITQTFLTRFQNLNLVGKERDKPWYTYIYYLTQYAMRFDEVNLENSNFSFHNFTSFSIHKSKL